MREEIRGPAGRAELSARLAQGGRRGYTAVRRRLDAVSLLTIYLVLLLAVPATLKIASLRNLGSLSVIFGLLMAGVWVYWQLQRVEPTYAGSQPIRIAYFVVVTCVGFSFVAAMTRPIDTHETNAAVLAVLALASGGGILLLGNDGIVSRERYVVLLRRLVLAGALFAVVGLVQFATGLRLVDQISLPGFINAQNEAMIGTRSGFNRPSSTALHGIEFGYVITVILPVAINLAIVDRSRSALRRVLPVALLLLAVVTSISRSALICGFVAILVIAPGWPRSVRRLAMAMSPLVAVLVFVTIPGLLGTVLGLFTGIAGDTSALSRTSSYAIAGDFVQRAPIVGRGFGTFTPAYRILDNAYLLLLIETGVLGLVSVLALLLAGMWCARRACDSGDEVDALLGQATLAALASSAVGLALFDGLSFPMASGTLFLFLGLAGAHWRLVRQRSVRA